jgi:AAA domain
MTHPLFRQDVFVETAFEKRFQAMLRSAWHKRSWHVIVADPGSGKTMGIRDMVKTAGSPAILAVTSPKNNDDEQALGGQLFGALGIPSRGHWSARKPKLMGHLHHYGTQCLIVDDAQDLSLQHLMFIKELTDQGRLQYDHPLGLCLVAAGRGDTIPLKETLDLPDIMWLQFRRRMDKLEPFCRIAGHTSEEVRDILAALETVYGELFPQLNLRQWSSIIYTWLTQPGLDPTRSGRVTMDYLMKLVTTVLEWSYEAGDTGVVAETLEKAAELLVLRRNTLRLIDGEGPSVEVHPPEAAEQGSVPQAETGEAPALDPPKQLPPHRDEMGMTQTEVQSPHCSFSGSIQLEAAPWLESMVQEVQCPSCGSVSKAKVKAQSVVISPHPPRKSRPVRNVTRWMEQGTEWVLVQKKDTR